MPAQEIARETLDSIYENQLLALERLNLGETTTNLRQLLQNANLRISRLYNHHDQGDRLNAAYTVSLLNARHIAAILDYRHHRHHRQLEFAQRRNNLGFRNPRRG